MDDLLEIEEELATPCGYCKGGKKEISAKFWCRDCGGSGQHRTEFWNVIYVEELCANPPPYLLGLDGVCVDDLKTIPEPICPNLI